jgi:hypothetical protein
VHVLKRCCRDDALAPHATRRFTLATRSPSVEDPHNSPPPSSRDNTMARTTRSKPKAKEPTPEPPVSTIKPLSASTTNPPSLFVLPRTTSKEARIVSLDNPAHGAPSRYLFCPDKGFHEFTRIAAPKKACRSWLLAGGTTEDGHDREQEGSIAGGYVSKSADLFVATPVDVLFLVLPALAPKSAKDTQQHYLALDDYLDKLSSSSRTWRALLSQYSSLIPLIEKRMRALCDTVEAGSESMYRLSHDKLLALLLKRAESMVTHGLPPSLEEKFVKSALDIPIMNIKREDSTLSAMSTEQLSATTSMTSDTSADTAITVPDTHDQPTKPVLQTTPQIQYLLRLRTSLTYLTSSYLPPTLRSIITSLLSQSSSTLPDFSALDMHLAAIASLKSEAAALRSISDNISRKRAFEDDDEKIAEREEKKRKKEDEEKKKKSEGRSIKQLKKVDTSGMKKMSAFFTKVPKKA